MMPSQGRHLFVVLISFCLIAGILYIKSPFSPHSDLQPVQQPTLELTADQRIDLPLDAKKRVAIIGAGASGSAAAFFLERAAREAGLSKDELEIVVFEREDYVGGRKCLPSAHHVQIR
jgi:prenylcysteine oxidase/farnesylcysteine lyase